MSGLYTRLYYIGKYIFSLNFILATHNLYEEKDSGYVNGIFGLIIMLIFFVDYIKHIFYIYISNVFLT